MVMECCYCGKRKDEDTNVGRTFHQFPLKQSKLLECWLGNMRIGPRFKPLKSMRLCSDHFSTESLRKIGVNVQLAEGSIPTLFGTYKSACAYCSAVKTQEHHRSFHKFPLKNPVLLQKWLEAMNKKDYVRSASCRLCSDHFERTCFRSSGYGDSLRLTVNAIPTIFRPVLLEVDVEKINNDASEELPAAKHLRLDTKFEAPVKSKLLSPTLRTSDVAEFMTTVEHDKASELRRSSTPTEGLVSGDVLNQIPEGTLTSTCSKQQTTPNTAQRIYMITHDHQNENTPRTTRKKLMSSKQ